MQLLFFIKLIPLYMQAGILRDKTMANKLMYISYDYSENYPFCRLQLWSKRLDTVMDQQNLIKSSKSC